MVTEITAARVKVQKLGRKLFIENIYFSNFSDHFLLPLTSKIQGRVCKLCLFPYAYRTSQNYLFTVGRAFYCPTVICLFIEWTGNSLCILINYYHYAFRISASEARLLVFLSLR